MAKKKFNKGSGIDEFEETAGRKANLFELSVLAVMPRDVYGAIKDRMGLALDCLEAGAENTAIEILKDFLDRE
jgi:hypothetical protein